MFKLFFVSFALTASLHAQAPVTGVLHTPDVDLAYEVYGSPSSATPVFAVNGGPGLSHQYMLQNDVWPRLSAHRQIIMYDQRGTGKSQHVREGASQTMAAQVADLEAIRAHLNLPRIDLVGDSYGGLVSIAYTAAHPDRVERLVLSDSAAPNPKKMVHLLPDVFPDVEERSAAEQAKLGDTPEASNANLIAHFRMIFYSPELRDEYLNKFLAKDKTLGSTPATSKAVWAANQGGDLTAMLPAFHCPTLVVTGRYDMNVAPINAWLMHKAIPGARFEAFEKSGHLPSYEEPEKYVKVLDEFFNENASDKITR
ncbi:alpha/beta fold hydrolase [Granulicella tundricola]|uniref:Alpha/beta hydrolase fold protein n=1 Tax=Granulicella tundricola (strain ATCC BAA-1859 / DSM 23138 / MP5ACTX9) TaxID=1198114 RepID=E8X6X4_GRATM|nr:alpha/beta hydrolase [Granulicella tundricola]ADW71083.1 alpha/beta hydrolase fold protein [Granulicella tundricola MP5ACTX9]